MAVKVVRVVYEADTTDIARAKELFAQVAKETGLSEQKVAELSHEIQKQTGLLNRLETQEKELVKQRKESNDPTQIKKLTTAIHGTQAEMQKLTATTKQAAGGFSMLKQFIIGGLAVNVITQATTAMANFAKAGIRSALEYEKTTAQLTGLAGSAAKAEKIMEELESFEGSGLMDSKDLSDAAKVLLSYGISADEIIPRIQKLGDISLGTGVSVESLSQSYVKLQAKGEGAIRELISLNQQGIPVFEQLAKQMGLTKDEVEALAAEGKISADEVVKAFDAMTESGGQFFKQTEKIGDTSAGQFALLSDNLEDLGRAIAQNVLPLINGLLGAFNSLFGTVEDTRNEFQKQADTLIVNKGMLNAYVNSLDNVNKGSIEYESLIKSINEVYPDFFTNLDANEASYEDIRDRLIEVNAEMDKQIGLLQRQGIAQSFKDDLAKIGKAIGDNSRAVFEFIEGVNKFSGEIKGSPFQSILDDAKKSLDAGESLIDILPSLRKKTEDAINAGAAPRAASVLLANLKVYEKMGPALKTYGAGLANAEAELKKYIEANQLASTETEDVGDETKKTKEQLAEAEKAAKEHAKAVEELAKALAKLRAEAELAAVGGADTEAGIEILRARALAELEANKAFTQLTEDEQGALRLEINEAWDEKLTALRKKTAADAKAIQDGLNKELEAFREENFLTAVADAKRLTDIKALQAKLDFANGLISEKEMNQRIQDSELEHLAARLQIEKDAGKDTIQTEQEIADAKVKIHKEGEDAKTEATEKAEKDRTATQEEAAAKAQAIYEESISQFVALFQAINDLQAAQAAQQLDDIDKRRDKALKDAGNDEAKKAAIEEKFAAIREKAEREENIRKQNFAVAQALIDGALAQIKLVAQYGLPTALPFMAIAAIITGIQVATIKAQKFAKGVIDLQGPGTGTSDSIPASLSRGESVMTAEETRLYRPALRAMRERMISPELMNAMAMGRMIPVNSIQTNSFSDERIVSKLATQNKNSAKLIKEVRKQNEFLYLLSLRDSQYRGGNFRN